MVNRLIKKSALWVQQEHQSILSAAAIISVSYMASAFLGLIRNRLLAAKFFGGLEKDLDVYFAASVIPDTLFQLLVVGAVSAAFVPVYQDYLSRSKEEATKMANATLTSFGLLMGVLTLLLFIFAPSIAAVSTHFDRPQTELMTSLIRIMSLAQLFFTVSAFLTGVLQSQKRFLIPAIAPLFYNLGTIMGIFFLSPYIGIYSAAVGMVIGAFFHLLIQLPLARSLGFVPRPVFNLKNEGSLTIFRLMPGRSLALGIGQIERYAIINLSSLLTVGSLTLFSFARQLYLLPVSLFGVALGQASFPSLAEDATQKDSARFRETLSKALMQTIFFSLPASVLLLILRIPIVRLVFGADHFPWDATLQTGKVLAILSLSIATQAAIQVIIRSFYAKKDTRTPLLVSLVTILLFVGLGWVFTNVYAWGIVGIAIALTFSNSIDFILLYLLISRKIGRLSLGYKFAKMFVASFFTALFLWAPMRLLDQFVFDTTRTLPLIMLTVIVSAIGGFVYLALSAFFEVEELDEVKSMVKKLGNWRQILVESDEVLESSTT